MLESRRIRVRRAVVYDCRYRVFARRGITAVDLPEADTGNRRSQNAAADTLKHRQADVQTQSRFNIHGIRRAVVAAAAADNGKAPFVVSRARSRTRRENTARRRCAHREAGVQSQRQQRRLRAELNNRIVRRNDNRRRARPAPRAVKMQLILLAHNCDAVVVGVGHARAFVNHPPFVAGQTSDHAYARGVQCLLLMIEHNNLRLADTGARIAQARILRGGDTGAEIIVAAHSHRYQLHKSRRRRGVKVVVRRYRHRHRARARRRYQTRSNAVTSARRNPAAESAHRKHRTAVNGVGDGRID